MGLKYSSFTIRGIDVSQFNGNIDWTKVSANFSAIRVGYGATLDTKFMVNWQAAKGKVNRIPYWYLDYYSNHITGATVNGTADTDWGKAQADNCWNAIKQDPDGAVFLDIESANSSGIPAISTVASRAQAIAQAFLEHMDEQNGKVNGIYCSLGLLTWFAAWFKDRPIWVAWYNESQSIQSVTSAVAKTGWSGKPLIWQYASDGDMDDNGSGDGLSMGMQYADLDLNAWLGTSQEYAAFFGQSATLELYRVKILINNLTVRTGPGTLYPRLRRADFPGEYGIFEEKNGFGRISPLKSEWISLSPEYVQRLAPDPVTSGDTDGGSTASPVLYAVKILIFNLSVRSGPAASFPFLRRANFPGEYNIYEEKDGYGRISETGSEWISLSTQYVQRLSSKSILSDAEKLARLWAAHPELH
jgi:GH25 family lysozyme M1 (1,4-beta-N-acetylmuramidase)